MSEFIKLTVVGGACKSYVRHDRITAMTRSGKYTALTMRGHRASYDFLYEETPDQIAEKIREVTHGLR